MLLLLSTSLALGAFGDTSGQAAQRSTPVPACPDLEGWAHAGEPGTIDSGNHVQFTCAYAQPGRGEQPSYDAFWYKPSARDVDVNYSDCGRPATGGSYYRDIWSKTHLVNIEYRVSGAVSGATNVAVFAAERERLDRTALALLAATEKLAKSCVKTAPKPVDATRPTVSVRLATGHRGTNVKFAFRVGDNSGKAKIVLTIYGSANRRTVLLRKSYGIAVAPRSGRSYTATIHARSAGTHLWCIAATDAAGNTASACARLVVT
jgi:hypothetical protein